MKEKLFFAFALLAAVVMVSCSSSPLSKMQSIAKDATEKGSSWSADDWINNAKDFENAALEFFEERSETGGL